MRMQKPFPDALTLKLIRKLQRRCHIILSGDGSAEDRKLAQAYNREIDQRLSGQFGVTIPEPGVCSLSATATGVGSPSDAPEVPLHVTARILTDEEAGTYAVKRLAHQI